jgi:hypothetical protein
MHDCCSTLVILGFLVKQKLCCGMIDPAIASQHGSPQHSRTTSHGSSPASAVDADTDAGYTNRGFANGAADGTGQSWGAEAKSHRRWRWTRRRIAAR